MDLKRLLKKFNAAQAIYHAHDPRRVEARLFGCDRHKMIRLPPASVKHIAGWEQKHGVRLPADLRAFYRTWSAGGAGPSYGVWSLEEAERFHGADMTRRIGQPCTVTAADLSGSRVSMTQLGGADWSERWDNNTWSPYAGTLALSDLGCGMHLLMIITGACRGRLVVCEPQLGFAPVDAGTVWEWYESWLDYIITKKHPGGNPGF
jgi:hypothetical protein